MPKHCYLVKISLIFKSGKKRLFLYHILTPKGQSVPQNGAKNLDFDPFFEVVVQFWYTNRNL